MMDRLFLTGSGLYFPPETISTEELVAAYNTYAEQVGNEVVKSDAHFIDQVSGIQSRHVMNRSGILNSQRMYPEIPKRSNDELSIQAEFGVNAARAALENTGIGADRVDAVIVACSGTQRIFPAISIEIQNALEIKGWAFDVHAACASAVFGINMAVASIHAGLADTILVVVPELYTGQVNFKDRRSHFIFGDGAAAVVIERTPFSKKTGHFKIVSTRLMSRFSNNIRNNFGFLNRCETGPKSREDCLFSQNGARVMAEVVQMAIDFIGAHMDSESLSHSQLKRLWLHQANIRMNQAIASGVFGRAVKPDEAPITLTQYGNIGAAGVLAAFHLHHEDLQREDYAVMSAFGAGYAIGSIILQKG